MNPRLMKTVLTTSAFLMILVACASDPETISAPTPPPPVELTPPEDHPFAQIQKGMPFWRVISILGAPTAQESHMTGKSFIPFYFGSDSSRQVWSYAGMGRIYFSSGGFRPSHVTRVEFEPNYVN